MICKNCGGEYAYTDLQCPYCHTENKEMANRIKAEILQEYDREAEKITQEAELYPGKEVRKRTKFILCGVGVLFVLVIIVAAVVSYNTRISADDEYEERLQHTEKLEEYLTAGDYAGMNAYIAEEELVGYDKYSQICNMYVDYVDMLEMAEMIEEYDWGIGEDKKIWTEWNQDYLVYIIEDVNRIVRSYEENVQDKVFLGNEDVLEEIYEKGVGDFRNFGFTEEDLAEFPVDKENPARGRMIEKLADYFWENAQATGL